MATPPFDPVINVDDAPTERGDDPAPYTSHWRVLTPRMREAGGSLGVVHNCLPPGAVGCPFHWHATEDEVFYVLSGRGMLRYGDTIREVGPGDCISCPAGTRTAHQLGNPFTDDLVYLAIGPREPNEVCGYPDSGKVMVRHLQTVGVLDPREYLDGERGEPRILSPGKDLSS
ncbi:MAG: cupin domain-containing protein [Deltaproteobacteria bacterium]|nr:cupin domain-containing protein [Deltaproteobacteria bacterium]